MAIKLDFEQAKTTALEADWLLERNIRLSVLRLDLLHPEISGNKWFKLKENIRLAFANHKTGLLTFGGQWSNHLAATAAAAKSFNLRAIAMIRGFDEEATELTATLAYCRSSGMQLKGLGRAAYRRKGDFDFLEELKLQYPDFRIIPEGGNNEAGRLGAGEIADLIPQDVSAVALAVGTGTTFAGIRNRLSERKTMVGFAPFRKIKEQKANIQKYCPDVSGACWTVFPDAFWRGFGKKDERLFDFMNAFYKECYIPLDFIYTAKMMYGLKGKILSGYFSEGSHILAIHTGGLQGNYAIRQHLHYK